MKQSDIAVIILITGISLFAAFIIGNSFIKPPDNRSSKAEVVVEINDDIGSVDTSIFNANAIDPAETILIGNQNTDRPFTQQ